jgi:hypothetical protein
MEVSDQHHTLAVLLVQKGTPVQIEWGGCVDPQSLSNGLEKRQTSCVCWDLNPEYSRLTVLRMI